MATNLQAEIERRYQELVAQFGASPKASQLAGARRCAELDTLAADARSQAIAGKDVLVSDICKLEQLRDQSFDRLDIPVRSLEARTIEIPEIVLCDHASVALERALERCQSSDEIRDVALRELQSRNVALAEENATLKGACEQLKGDCDQMRASIESMKGAITTKTHPVPSGGQQTASGNVVSIRR